jgi:hypothetical protein
MNKHSSYSAHALLAVCALAAIYALTATAQGGSSLAGTYVPVGNPPFGDGARGQLILTPEGRYTFFLARATLPKFASGLRTTGTADENKAVVAGSLAHSGKYTVDAKEGTLTFIVEAATFPNWDGQTFKRPYKLSGDQLSYTNSAPSGGGSGFEAVWKRVH